ncbi:LysR family transcriptional regulator [Ideonella dechloratans]|uniref:LysR family transcriptional regulator n=1 Tax=Ideonella dechloratans TaxID=36863 RepID=A0A643FGG4_IDEDE|nr:LysR family transcriptional regulator [Ideonella dechloratans]KAB0584962.1 LysR family transcriptional regulator [Ideonella dechloratans]UFU11528.1 LysR family transcriptional regulator [Ideonella dechloratans]
MRRKLPSTAALAAFEAAARHQSYTRAASELAVTQSAICRQIASLEDFLGVKLFRRSQRGVALTEAGQRYSRRVAARLDEVERDALDLMSGGEEGGGSLELAVVPTFATQWLLPRLGDFQRQHPGITLHFTPRTRPFLFTDTPFDAAILPGSEPWPGTESIDLLPEPLVAVASPRLPGAQACRSADDVARLPLLQASTRPDGWRQWFASLGRAVEHDMAGPRMELFSMLSEAAAQGLGVALVPRLLVESDLASGRLVVVLPHPHASGRSYRLIYPPHKADGPLLQALASWLTGQAAAYRAQA